MKKVSLSVVLAAVIALSGCGLTKKDLGFKREGPDETKVIKHEPLILPPEYNVRPAKTLPAEEADFNE